MKRILVFCFLALTTLSPNRPATAAPPRPNIIVILVDDMG